MAKASAAAAAAASAAVSAAASAAAHTPLPPGALALLATVAQIYPPSDFRHPVLTPMSLLMGEVRAAPQRRPAAPPGIAAPHHTVYGTPHHAKAESIRTVPLPVGACRPPPVHLPTARGCKGSARFTGRV